MPNHKFTSHSEQYEAETEGDGSVSIIHVFDGSRRELVSIPASALRAIYSMWALDPSLPHNLILADAHAMSAISRLPKRLQRKIFVDESGCWVWTGYKDKDGYGKSTISGRNNTMAGRVVYELLLGKIADGITVDHLCLNRACVNPAHFELVDLKTNILRSNNPPAKNARKTHCIHGHEFTPENTGATTGGHRYCRTCMNERVKVYQKQKRDALRSK